MLLFKALTERRFRLTLQFFFRLRYTSMQRFFITDAELNPPVSLGHVRESVQVYTQSSAHWRNRAPSQLTDQHRNYFDLVPPQRGPKKACRIFAIWANVE